MGSKRQGAGRAGGACLAAAPRARFWAPERSGGPGSRQLARGHPGAGPRGAARGSRWLWAALAGALARAAWRLARPPPAASGSRSPWRERALALSGGGQLSKRSSQPALQPEQERGPARPPGGPGPWRPASAGRGGLGWASPPPTSRLALAWQSSKLLFLRASLEGGRCGARLHPLHALKSSRACTRALARHGDGGLWRPSIDDGAVMMWGSAHSLVPHGVNSHSCVSFSQRGSVLIFSYRLIHDEQFVSQLSDSR